jgi:hypothetical protein
VAVKKALKALCFLVYSGRLVLFISAVLTVIFSVHWSTRHSAFKSGLLYKSMKSRVKRVDFPAHSKELAELIGIILGDGNIQSFVKKGEGVATYCVRITGHSEELPYYHEYIIPLCRSLFNSEPKTYFHKKQKEVFILLCGKMFVSFFSEHGLPPGDKIKNKVSIPQWVWENDDYLKACVRGLIDTDGSVHRMSRKAPTLVRISFKNLNPYLLNDCKRALEALNFHPSKIICGSHFFLSRQKEITNYIKEIGFANKKHIMRYQRFSPVV